MKCACMYESSASHFRLNVAEILLTLTTLVLVSAQDGCYLEQSVKYAIIPLEVDPLVWP